VKYLRIYTALALLGVACGNGSNGDSQGPAGLESDPSGESEDTVPFHDRPLEEALERWEREFAGEFGETLQEYAAKCDVATGIHVPDFNCASGTLVPTTNFSGTTCDRPNRLNRVCDPGSHFQVVAQNADAVAVAHCRRQGNTGNNFSDIAVIQYNKVNGAVCFYQNDLTSQDGTFKAPSRGTSLSGHAAFPDPTAARWLSPAGTRGINCASCHDNGAIIRSPYLAQLSILPGAGDNSYNRTQPMSFIGNDFQDHRLYSVSVAGNVCNGCHRMGMSESSTGGTARDFGLRATAMSEAAKNPHSASSPIWMLPGQITFAQSSAEAAAVIASCANAFSSGGPLPSGCSVAQFSKTWDGATPASVTAALASVTVL
jgi:hypothetical protein